MSNEQSSLDELIQLLQKQRDEVKRQLDQAGQDAKQEYDRLAKKCDQLSEHYKPVSDAAGEAAENVLTAFGMVIDELKFGFDRVRKAIGDSAGASRSCDGVDGAQGVGSRGEGQE